MAQQYQDYLQKFLEILSKLERVTPEGAADPTGGMGNGMGMNTGMNGGMGMGGVGAMTAAGMGAGGLDEESELRHWADLREYQLKFQEQGGVYGFS